MPGKFVGFTGDSMLVQWYANLLAEEGKVMPKVDELMRKGAQATNGKILGGPYHSQKADILYLVEWPKAEDFQRAGKWFMTEMAKSGVALEPHSYEIAFACGEAGGP